MNRPKLFELNTIYKLRSNINRTFKKDIRKKFNRKFLTSNRYTRNYYKKPGFLRLTNRIMRLRTKSRSLEE